MSMTKNDFIAAINESSDAEDTLELWKRVGIGPDALCLDEIVTVHQACGKKIMQALELTGRVGEKDETSQEAGRL